MTTKIFNNIGMLKLTHFHFFYSKQKKQVKPEKITYIILFPIITCFKIALSNFVINVYKKKPLHMKRLYYVIPQGLEP